MYAVTAAATEFWFVVGYIFVVSVHIFKEMFFFIQLVRLIVLFDVDKDGIIYGMLFYYGSR